MRNANINSPKKILFCEAGAHGGSVKRITNLLNNIDLNCFSPSIITCFKTSKAEKLLNLSEIIPSYTLGLTEFPAPDVISNIGSFPLPTLLFYKYLTYAIKVILKERPSLIYLNNTPYCHLPVILAAKIFKVKVLCHMRDSIKLTKSEKWALNNVELIITLSESHKKFYLKQGVQASKIVVIYNGINLKEFDAAAGEDVNIPQNTNETIAFVGVLSARKRQKDAINALGLLAKDFPHLRLIFLGDGPDKDMLQTIVKEKGLEKNIIFQGMVSSVAPYLIKCKIGLMLSDREGMPNVILEYMAAKIPVITTNLPGVQEMVSDRETGFIVPIGNIESISAMIHRLLKNPHEANLMGKRGRIILESGKFTVESELSLINQLLSNA